MSQLEPPQVAPAITSTTKGSGLAISTFVIGVISLLPGRNLKLPGDPEPPQQREGESGDHFFARLLETPMPGDTRPLPAPADTAA